MKLFNLFFIGLLLVAAFILIQMPAQAKSTLGKEFVENATIGTNFEIMSSKLALEKSADPEVKTFAQKMIDDHTKAGNQLKVALQASQVNKSAAEVGLDAKHQATYDALNQAPVGGDFDRLYIDAQNKAHEEAVALFESYARMGEDNSLKEFAQRTLPTLQKHREHAVKLKAKYNS